MVITIFAEWSGFFYHENLASYMYLFQQKKNLFWFSCRNKLEINIVELGNSELQINNNIIYFCTTLFIFRSNALCAIVYARKYI